MVAIKVATSSCMIMTLDNSIVRDLVDTGHLRNLLAGISWRSFDRTRVHILKSSGTRYLLPASGCCEISNIVLPWSSTNKRKKTPVSTRTFMRRYELGFIELEKTLCCEPGLLTRVMCTPSFSCNGGGFVMLEWATNLELASSWHLESG